MNNCGLFKEKQAYQLCKCNAASFNMMCDVEYVNTGQSLVRLFDFRLLGIVQQKTNFKLSLNRFRVKRKIYKILYLFNTVFERDNCLFKINLTFWNWLYYTESFLFSYCKDLVKI